MKSEQVRIADKLIGTSLHVARQRFISVSDFISASGFIIRLQDEDKRHDESRAVFYSIGFLFGGTAFRVFSPANHLA